LKCSCGENQAGLNARANKGARRNTKRKRPTRRKQLCPRKQQILAVARHSRNFVEVIEEPIKCMDKA